LIEASSEFEVGKRGREWKGGICDGLVEVISKGEVGEVGERSGEREEGGIEIISHLYLFHWRREVKGMCNLTNPFRLVVLKGKFIIWLPKVVVPV
jgi:hypothetical protein